MMLALNMKLLTNKFQQQTLDEGQPSASNIKLISPDVSLKLSESAQAKLGAGSSGKKVWTVSLNSDSNSPGQEGEFTCPQSQCEKNAGVQVTGSYKKPVFSSGLSDTPASSDQISTERGKKRHCRSICVPQETEINIPPAKSSWQPQGSGLWKPVTMSAVRNCSRAGLDGKFDMRTVRWSPTECKNYEFFSLAPVKRHMETGHITPDDLLTPPESPVPRPNSVYSDGAVSPFTSDPYLDYTHSRMHHIQEFRNRSLSVEDKISLATQTLTGPTDSGSMSNVLCQNNSVPSSPHHRYRVPRCRSQPSFYDRKCGRRRRRDLRPTLNFHKMMTERKGARFHSELENAMSLTTIASSPQDSDISPHSSQEHRCRSPISELESFTCDSVSEEDSVGGNCGPVKLLGDEEQDENDMEVFQLTEELDLEQIENH